MDEQLRHIYEFGEFSLDARERLLRREGQIVALPPKAAELLFALLESGGRMMTKEELMRRVWADSFVEEANLAQNIFLLRKILRGKNSEQFIETIPRRGYRFAADVRQTSAANGKDPAFFAREQTLSRIVVEEEIEISNSSDTIDKSQSFVSPPLLENPKTQVNWKTILSLATALILLGGSAFLVSRFYGASQAAQMPPMRVIPVTSFPDYEYEPSLSPDGSLVAFSWSGGAGDTVEREYNIYVKQIDGGGEPLQLTRNQGRAAYPAFSPDGRYIAFLHGPGYQLSVIPALGGAGRKLYEATELRMPQWSPDGKTIVFVARPDSKTPLGVYTIALDTLEAKQLTAPANGEGDTYPHFSPDGRRLAFTHVEDVTSEIFVMNLPDGEPRRITRDNSAIYGLTWTADGREIVFSSNRGGDSMLWRVSAEGGEATALPGIGEGAMVPDISRKGDSLAFQHFQIDSNIWRVPAIESGKTRGKMISGATKIIASSRRDEMPALSPDGKKIAFSSTQSGAREIWLADAENGANQRQLTTFGGAYAARPSWSPDGKSIAFDARPNGKSTVFVADIESGAVRQITTDDANCIAPHFSADGAFVYYGAKRGDGAGWQIWKSPVAGGAPVQITTRGGYEARESSDGKFLYCRVDIDAYGFYRIPVNGDETERRDFPEIVGLLQPNDWALTDKGVYFINRYESPTKFTARPAIKFYDFATGEIMQIAALPKDPIVETGLSASPDGQWLYYSIDDALNSDIRLLENFR